jgi:phage gp36-like protein
MGMEGQPISIVDALQKRIAEVSGAETHRKQNLPIEKTAKKKQSSPDLDIDVDALEASLVKVDSHLKNRKSEDDEYTDPLKDSICICQVSCCI